VGFSISAAPEHLLTQPQQEHLMDSRPAVHQTAKLAFNVDAAAIVIALALAALIRLNVIPHIGW
jgi:hypothetical protein